MKRYHLYTSVPVYSYIDIDKQLKINHHLNYYNSLIYQKKLTEFDHKLLVENPDISENIK
jgi:hypothetical protein